MTMLRVVVFLCVVISTMSTTRACMCSNDHPQQDFCDADFVIRAAVKAKEEVNTDGNSYPTQIRYFIQIKKVYKTSVPFQNANKTVLYVPGTEWLCKQDLETDKTYVITGRVYQNDNDTEGFMHTTMCDFNHLFRNLTKHQRKFLKYTYEKNCECKVRTCHPKNTYCRDHVTDQECLYLDDPYASNVVKEKTSLFTKYSYCRLKNNRCTWRKNRMLMRKLNQLKKITLKVAEDVSSLDN